ncbi:hypothetical protein M0811_07653 [Anaeramoeba ignava]|uniref:Uncharacterized protein n=1 Tax=Anaeramoeba ignava TaxID=1746090 RepID=A0A9Q0RCA7_ANAIG|nr:hypothetical protein M0811_07653 [Anaeramoeba ignava]
MIKIYRDLSKSIYQYRNEKKQLNEDLSFHSNLNSDSVVHFLCRVGAIYLVLVEERRKMEKTNGNILVSIQESWENFGSELTPEFLFKRLSWKKHHIIEKKRKIIIIIIMIIIIMMMMMRIFIIKII